MSVLNKNNNTSCKDLFEIISDNNETEKHKAFDLTQLLDLEKIGNQLSSFGCYDEWFIIGTDSGLILIYKIKIRPNVTRIPTMLKRSMSIPNLGKYEPILEKSIYKTKNPIQQVQVIKQYDILITLFDSQIHIFDLKKFQLQESIVKTRGCSLFTADISLNPKILTLCVVVKKKIQFYYMSHSNSNFKELINDLELNDSPKTIQLNKNNFLIFSLRKDYYYYELPSTSTDLTKTLSVKQFDIKKPINNRYFEIHCEKLQNDFFILNIEDNKSIIYFSKLESEFEISWSSPPSSICNVGPYLIGLLPCLNCIEIMLIEPLTIKIQTLKFNSNEKLKSIVSNSNGVCYLISCLNIWCLTPIDINSQLEQCLLLKNYEIGTNLVLSHLKFISPESRWNIGLPVDSKSNFSPIAEFQANNFFSSFNSLNFELNDDLAFQIKKFHILNNYTKGNYYDSFNEFMDMNIDPSHVIGLVPGILPNKYKQVIKFDEYFPSVDSEELEKLIDLLTIYMQFKRSEILRKTEINFLPLIDGYPVSKTKETILKIIDTSIVKAYLIINKNLVPSVLNREPNFFNLTECEQLLESNNMYDCLVAVYEKKDLHDKALNILFKETRDNNKSAEDHLKQKENIVNYLSRNGAKDFQLILKYGKKLIEDDFEMGIKIFIKHSIYDIEKIIQENIEFKECKKIDSKNTNFSFMSTLFKIDLNKLPNLSNRDDKVNKNQFIDQFEYEMPKFDANSVCDFLKSKIKPETLGERLLRVYLEYLVFICGEKDPGLNNDLIDMYLKVVDLNEKTFKMRLIYLLKEKNCYEKSYALSKLNLLKYPEERAIVLGKNGRHFDALSIYINNLNDIEKAIAYCDHIYSNQSSNTSDLNVYSTLLGICLGSKYEEIRIGASIRILNSYSKMIGSSRNLEQLPADLMKFKNLTPYLENMLLQLIRQKNNTKVVNRLMFALRLQTYDAKIYLDKKIVVEKDTICKVCLKRFAASAIMRLPNYDLIHPGCYSKYNQIL